MGTITLNEPFTGTIEIQIPKSMPRMMNLNFDTRFLLEVKNDDINDHLIEADNILYDDRITETESLCNYILTIQLENTEYFEFGTGSVASGRWESVTIENDSCDDLYDELTMESEPEPESMIAGKFPPGAMVDCIGGFYFNGTNCVPDDLMESSTYTYYLPTYSIPIGIIIISLVIFVYWRKRK